MVKLQEWNYCEPHYDIINQEDDYELNADV